MRVLQNLLADIDKRRRIPKYMLGIFITACQLEVVMKCGHSSQDTFGHIVYCNATFFCLAILSCTISGLGCGKMSYFIVSRYEGGIG